MGSIYKRGNVWWVQYYRNGKAYQETSRSIKKMVARKLLELREGEVAQGKLPGIHFDKVRFDELAGDLELDYQHKGQKRPRTSHLRNFFEDMRAIDITSARIKAYIKVRKAEGAANSTVNRELAALKAMFRLGVKETPPKVDRVPYIPHLEENNVKQGFFEDEDYEAILQRLPSYLKGPVQFAYLTGWRREQIMGITWKMVNLKERLISVPGSMTKSGEPHTIYLNDPLLELMKERFSNRNLGCLYVFHRNGRRIRDFRHVWNKACRKVGLGYGYKIDEKYKDKWRKKFRSGPTLHDFRRTAVRNFNKDGIPENIAMKITGHKTNSTYKRYGIVTKDDLKWAAEKQAERMAEEK
jgi:integrase